ncbi:non-ribosomal peptide synthetase [Nocardiopsis sp. JB363]|uniref:non-ribosomal peptide synthetase n=1 Tax=Nocardiopsis sp. JB363 TaxID=1434837 RepID=UPI00097A8CA2|nr:non-ribosomal peptide synthetase [Nocardiopsis sp. JB363]SIO91387.1 non-ribosomal peptide synthetase [Nocardiopsis sp. JB363]
MQPCTSVTESFAETVATTPDSVAIIGPDTEHTFREVDAMADLLVGALYRAGLRWGERVVFLGERDTTFPVITLAVLRAGAIHVPLDPEWPTERNRHVVARGPVRFALVTCEQTAAASAELGIPHVLSVHRVLADPEGVPWRPDRVPGGAEAAYIAHTSGSSGPPKGVVTAHGSLAAHCRRFARRLGLDSHSRVLQFTSATIDISLEEIHTAWAVGAPVVTLPVEHRSDIVRFAEYVDRFRVGFVDLPTSFWRLWSEAIEAGDVPPPHAGLVAVGVGSEEVPEKDVRRWLALPGMRTPLYNLYGSTETSITTVVEGPITGGAPEPGGVVGRPMPGVTCYVLDPDLNPVAPGEAGELYMSGDVTALGYDGDPWATARRFVPDPFSDVPGTRMYGMGDRVSVDQDGRLRYHGRLDRTLKVHGFSVDPADVEEVIVGTPGVCSARVGLDSDEPGARLIAEVMVEVDEEKQVRAGWRDVYDAIYSGSERHDRTAGLDATGWFSARDSSLIGEDAMRSWRDDTAARLLELRPRRVLDLGCGTGMILHALAPHIERYVGVDFSSEAIGRLRENAVALASGLEPVFVEADISDALDQMEEEFDLVVLNSVVQHFIAADRLHAVLTTAAARTVPGATLFVGDVRNLDHSGDYHRWVRRGRPEGAELDEGELLLSPGYFAAIGELDDRPVRVRVDAKDVTDSEMGLFRFDALLHLDHAPAAGADRVSVADRTDSAMIAAALADRVVPGRPLLVRDVPLADIRLPGLAEAGVDVPSVGYRAPTLAADLEPFGVRVRATPGRSGPCRRDIVFHRDGDKEAAEAALLAGHRSSGLPAANNPGERHRRGLVSAIIERVRTALPRQSWPADYRMVDIAESDLPGTPGAPEESSVRGNPDHRSAIEAEITEVWQVALGGQEVGVHDDFFDLGGNSLNMARILTRVRRTYGVELSAKDFFAEPTVTGLSALVAARRTGSLRVSAVDGPRPGTATSGPASHAQERLWFLNRLHPGSTAYNSSFAFTVQGPADPAALAGAVRAVAREHPVLRTALHQVDGALRQTITDRLPEVRELIAVPGERPLENALSASERAFVAAPFDLAAAEVFRLGWSHIEGARTRLVFALHHAVIDEWSLRPFFESFSRAYAAELVGARVEPAPLPVRYLDHSVWEREPEQEHARRENETFWRGLLRDLPPRSTFPLDAPVPAIRSGRGARVSIPLPERFARRAQRLIVREGVTPYQFWLSMFGLFLAREVGSREVVVGVPSANRPTAESEAIVGFFVNTLPIRLDLRDNPTVTEFVTRTAGVLMEAQNAESVPLQRIAELVGGSRDATGNPLFQTMVILEPEESLGLELHGHEAVPIDADEPSSTVDLSLIVRTDEDGSPLPHFCYSTDLFDTRVVDAMRDRFLNLLGDVLSDPERRAGDPSSVPFSPSSLAGPTVDQSALELVHTVVRRVAERHPDRVAVIDGTREFDYRALVAWADRIAAQITARGAVPDFVPLHMGGGAHMVASMLAVNSLGAAFVPIDPDWPDPRVRTTLEDLGAPYRLVRRESDGGVQHGTEPVPVPSPPGRNDIPVSVREWSDTDLDAAMYVLHTSGSTGRPKGAINRHRAVANRLDWMDREFGTEAARAVLQTTPPHYDSCVWEYFWPLVNGGTTVVGPVSLQADPGALCEMIARHRITTIDMVPGLFRNLLDHVAARPERHADLDGLRIVVVGGEECTPAVVRAVRGLGLSARMFNLYGPTEAGIGSVQYELGSEPLHRVPIGKPIQNTTALVLDENLAPVPLGLRGELFLGGACVGRGYLGAPAATRRRFLRTDGHGLIYRTGDAARVRADGSLDFLGRLDDQTNISGVRVEPSEIVQVVEAVPGVREAVVVEVRDPADTSDRAALEDLVIGALTAHDPQARAAALAALELVEQGND